MRIGFDAKRIFRNTTGLGNYSRTLVRDLAIRFPEHNYYLFAAHASGKLRFPQGIQIISPNVSFKAYWRSFGIKHDLIKNNIDLYHGLSNEIPFSLRNTKIRTVVTIHDLIFRHYPNLYPLADRTVYQIKTKYACKNADIIIAASEATKKDIMQTYGTDEKRIAVVYQSCNEIFFRNIALPSAYLEKYKLPQAFLLYVGSINERKNILNICKAYLQIDAGNRLPCVIIGRGGAYADKVKNFISVKGLGKYFIFFDSIPDEELPFFYRRATAFIYPSLYEGFGIPVLEAMASGCPVITSSISSLPEVAGDAALYTDPHNTEELANCIQRLTMDDDLQNELRKKGKQQAEKFSALHSAEATMAVYRELL